jgi:toxin HigB-1
MILSFADAKTEAFYRDGKVAPAWRTFEDAALRRPDMLNAAVKLTDLRSHPGNRLEALRGAP